MRAHLFCTVSQYLRLLRSSVWVTFLMTLGGGWLAAHQFDWANRQIWLAALTVSLATAFGNVQNDLLDLRVDAINCPMRPLPSGRIPSWAAGRLAHWLFVASLMCAFLCSWALFHLTLLALILTLFYNLWAKRVPLLGNVVVAGLCALCLASGYFVLPQGELPLIPVVAAFLFVLARELMATILDQPGDRIGGRRSVCDLWGTDGVLLVCLVLAALTLAALCVPTFNLPAPQQLYYLASILLTFGLPVALAAVAIARDPRRSNLQRVAQRLRYVYLTTFVSFLWLV